MLGGDRFYTAARWVVLVLLFATSGLITGESAWPPTRGMSPFLLLIWGYALFNVLATLALFLPALGGLLSVAFLVDIVFITLLTYFSQSSHDLFYPLYFLPLVGAAIRLRPSYGLVAGLIAAGVYVVAYLLARVGPDNGRPPRDALELVALALRAMVLAAVPWLTSGLAERWGVANRHTVVLAEKQTEQAWREANTYRDQTRALYEVAYSLSTTMNYQSVLDAALAESRKLVPYTVGVVLLSTGEPRSEGRRVG